MDKPKIVFWDLETLPSRREVYKNIPSFGAWPGRGFKGEIQRIMSFGFKILGDDKAQCINAWDIDPEWKDREDDRALCHIIYNTLCDADEIVTHNGKSFDLKVLNTRLLYYGHPPLPKIHHVDTKITAKKLSFYSNSLANVAKYVEVEDKMTFNNKWKMWYDMAFHQETQQDRDIMSEYCKQDVEVLEQIYLELQPYHGNSSINRNHWVDAKNPVCPSCGSKNLGKNGIRRTQTTVFQRYLCGDCGTTSRTDKKDLNPKVL